MAEIIVIALLVAVFVATALVLRFGHAESVYERAYDNDDEGWIPHDLGPVSGYASVSQGGQRVGYVGMRRLHLPAGWESGQKGMRPYTKKAREEYERRKRGNAG